jgi:hypothetical protein
MLTTARSGPAERVPLLEEMGMEWASRAGRPSTTDLV